MNRFLSFAAEGLFSVTLLVASSAIALEFKPLRDVIRSFKTERDLAMAVFED